MRPPICAWRRRVQHEVGTHHCDVYESFNWMGGFDHSGMACIMPFKVTYRPLWEYGARKAQLALVRAVVVVLNFIAGTTPDTVYVHILGQVGYAPGILG